MDHLVKYKEDLAGIFQKTLQNPTLDIKLAALQATANYLSIAERKETKACGCTLGDAAKLSFS